MQWAIWRAGGVAVPLCTGHPPPERQYTIENADCDTIVLHSDYSAVGTEIETYGPKKRILTGSCMNGYTATQGAFNADFKGRLPEIDRQRRALIIYTSGTTGPPKVGLLDDKAEGR